jgi:hypothetical protein
MSTQSPIPGAVPPSGPPPDAPPSSRMVSWFLTSVFIGWLIAYNVLRFQGRSPRGAAWPSLLIGIAIGVVIFGCAVLFWRRFVASGRLRPHHIDEIPPPERMDARQRSAVEVLWPGVAVLAAFALIIGAILAADWLRTSGERSTTKIVLAAWDLLVGIWLAMEATELRRLHGEAIESIALAAMLTSILAGVAFSLNMFGAAQVALVVVAGIVGAMAHFAGWRLLGSRGVPIGVALALIVAALAIIFPLTF